MQPEDRAWFLAEVRRLSTERIVGALATVAQESTPRMLFAQEAIK